VVDEERAQRVRCGEAGDEAALLALIENSLTLQKSLAHAERETQRRSLEMQQHLAGLIRRGSRVFVGF
jgi:hypothetical protein